MINNLLKKAGVTIVELSMVIGVSAVIALAFQLFLHQSNRLTGSAFRMQNSQSALLSSMIYLMRDMRSAYRYSMGNIMQNGSFEEEDNPSTPRHWDNAVGGNGQYRYTDGEVFNDTRGGLRSLALKSDDNNLVTYSSTTPIKLTKGNAYMVTGWVMKVGPSPAPPTECRITLLDNNDNVLGFSTTTSVGWSRLQFRYPPNGTYVQNSIPANEVHFQLSVDNSDEWAFFDNISLSSIRSVLLSPILNAENTNRIPNPFDVFEPVGFQFVREIDGQAIQFRYRIGTEGSINYLIRERFNSSLSDWEEVSPTRLFMNAELIEFTFDMLLQVPDKANDSPITFTVGLRDAEDKSQTELNLTELEFYALSP
ncbi:hypothetical protein BVX98_01950 [bacterium F11]|nr:hypothetical protein BVX98_01950 [bacterium F11]